MIQGQQAVSITGQLTGTEAPYNSISEFVSGEFLYQQVRKNRLIDIPLTRELPNRKIYMWLWCDASAVTFAAIGQITFFNRGQQAGTSLPVSVANGSLGASSQSVPSICLSGGNAVADSIGLYVFNANFGQPGSIVLQPFYLYGAVDRVVFDLVDINNVSQVAGHGVRGWLGVISSQ